MLVALRLSKLLISDSLQQRISSVSSVMVSTRRNKRSASTDVDLVEVAKKPKMDSDYEEQFLSHFKKLFDTELTTMEGMIRNLLRDVTNKDREIETIKEESKIKIARVVKENQSLKGKIEELKKDKLDTQCLQKEVEDLQQALKSKEASRISQREKMDKLEAEILSKTEKIKGFEVRLKERKDRNILEAKEKMEKYRKRIEDIEDEKNTLSRENVELKTQLAKQSKVLSTTEEENYYLCDAKDDLENALKKKEEESKVEIETALTAERSGQRKIMKEIKQKYEKDVTLLKHQLSEEKSVLEKKEKRVEQLERDLQIAEKEKTTWNDEKIIVKKILEKHKVELNEDKDKEILRLKTQVAELEEYDRHHLNRIHRLEDIIYNEKDEELEVQLVVPESEKKVETKTEISRITATPVKRPRGRPKKNISSMEKELKSFLGKDSKTTLTLKSIK